MNRRSQRGFGLGLGGSFSDLLVPVIVIGILALIAIPSFNNYRALARVKEALRPAATARAAVEKAFATKGPSDMSQSAVTGWKAPAATAHLRSIAIQKTGVITLQFTESVAPKDENELQIVPVSGGKAVDLSHAASAGLRFEWQCGGAAGKTTLREARRPEECR